ncbi:MAG: TonB family protein [Gemmatimonadaceae bacterium]
MHLRLHHSGRLVDLTDAAILGEGGQARVLALSADHAAKLYHRPSDAHARKLLAMLRAAPLDTASPGGHASVAWPTDVLWTTESATRVAGFVMPRVRGMRPMFEFYNPRSRRRHCPLFTYEYLHRSARNVAVAVAGVHARGHVIGDLNESNVLVGDSALATLVDTDSFQVREARGQLHRCPVGKAEFTPPELQEKAFATVDRTPEHDLFALGVLIFQLLMEGAHPFMGEYQEDGEAPPLEARIAAGHFPHAGEATIPYLPPRHAPPFDALNPALCALFARCFREGHSLPGARPSAIAWQGALREAEAALVSCATNPQHRYDGHRAACPWCERAELLGGRDPFPSRAAVESGEAARMGRPAPVVQIALPSAGTPSTHLFLTPTAQPSPAAQAYAARAAMRIRRARPTRTGGRAAAIGSALHRQAATVRYAHVPWLAVALIVAVATLAASSVLVVLGGVVVALCCAATGWQRLIALRPVDVRSAALLLGFVALIFSIKVIAVATHAEPVEVREHRYLPPPTVSSPVSGSELPVAGASAGAEHTCGIAESGLAYCWGRNSSGELGLGGPDGEAYTSPTEVRDYRVRFRSVSAGIGAHVCGIDVSGLVECWGRNDHGQLGFAAGGPGQTIALHAASVTTGGAHTCALADDGAAMCFGSNEYGQLGDGSLVDSESPTNPVSAAGSFTALSAGERHTCALTARGEAYCWGSNEFGQLGSLDAADSCASSQCSRSPVRVATDLAFAAISAGRSHTCALTPVGDAYCWGADASGQAGMMIGDLACGDNWRVPACVSRPRPVVTRHRFATISAGGEHTCALTSDGAAYCWGSDDRSQLGTAEPRMLCDRGNDRARCTHSPVAVAREDRFESISAGARHTCAVLRRQVTLCWGANGQGQVGNGAIGRVAHLRPVAPAIGADAFAQVPAQLEDSYAAGAPLAPRSVRLDGVLTRVYGEREVDIAAVPLATNPEPGYPSALRRMGIEGDVVADVVIDARGRPVMATFSVSQTSHARFTSAVEAALPAMRFVPATIAGESVPQMVRLPFRFRLRGRLPGREAL